MGIKTVSIIGCGWLGLPLAEQLLKEGFRVKGSTTSPDKLRSLQRSGIEAYQLRLNPQPEGNLAGLLDTDTLIIDIPPKAGKLGDNFHPQQVQYVADAIRSSRIKHVIYVSSTSVYPERSQTAREEDITQPEESAAPGLVRTEKIVQSLDILTTILRCGGLMGYDRIPGKYVAGRTVDSCKVPVNYLHRDDAVGILSRIVQQPLGGVFNVVAPEHPSREAIYRKSCADFGYELPTFVEPLEPLPFKVISVEKLLGAMTYTFTYRDPLYFSYDSGPKQPTDTRPEESSR